MSEKKVVLEEIVRIEGHLNVTLYGDETEIRRVTAEALEGTRILERVILGKNYMEIPDIASRMCGVCNVIHKLTATQAIENALDLEITQEAWSLRKLMVIGGHIQSHMLHLFYFVLPDLMGKPSLLHIADTHGELVKKIVKAKKHANRIIEITGGSRVHPVALVPGGISKPITKKDLENLRYELHELKKTIEEPIRFLLEIGNPEFENENIYVALTNQNTIPLLQGNISVSNNSVYQAEEYSKIFTKIREDYSTAPHFKLSIKNTSYMVGALARININHTKLLPAAKTISKEYDIKWPNNNPFTNNTAQALEILHYIEESEHIIDDLEEKKLIRTWTRPKIQAGDGIAVTEAPRGLLIHHYRLNSEGKVVWANIITPTAQNLKNVEETCRNYGNKLLSEGANIELIEKEIEKLVRAYDPCISCSARFYKETD